MSAKQSASDRLKARVVGKLLGIGHAFAIAARPLKKRAVVLAQNLQVRDLNFPLTKVGLYLENSIV
ncbi:hypothetical protein [Lactobacillus delbrueckii]|uniref:hypothetical protein n=1 Tax=Lactobacillus delbrueckii TaxID=1584 RepID=UPI001E6508C0|nr:hypothetical protein [Lactobacillus delbrueckii]